ncbi:MAG: MarR family transcriptional regulator [Phycisphaerae bacterium]|nr:MarR family transcriptional regulator [Phycisphaerae bacterium]MCZ2399348.1 MarR family transcriptional regulator [Phycisphaerae bacterium]NUQ48979.1 MarR family transcriptional regulator [Phycisphaerae bacterium]
MNIRQAMHGLLASYPRIFMACHREHRRHPRTGTRVSYQQAMILDHLDQRDPVSVSRLARHMGVTPSTMSLNLDRMERSRLVLRRRDRGDARRVLVTLSAAGARVKEDRQVLDPQCVRRLLSALTPEQRETAITGLRLLAHAADAMIEGSAGERRSDRSARDGDSHWHAPLGRRP